MKTKLSPYTIVQTVLTLLTSVTVSMKSRMKLKGLFPKEKMFRHSSTPGCQSSRQRGKNLNRKTRFT